MDTAIIRPSRPTTVEDLHRLAALGRDRGLTLFQEAGSNRATSPTGLRGFPTAHRYIIARHGSTINAP